MSGKARGLLLLPLPSLSLSFPLSHSLDLTTALWIEEKGGRKREERKGKRGKGAAGNHGEKEGEEEGVAVSKLRQKHFETGRKVSAAFPFYAEPFFRVARKRKGVKSSSSTLKCEARLKSADAASVIGRREGGYRHSAMISGRNISHNVSGRRKKKKRERAEKAG